MKNTKIKKAMKTSNIVSIIFIVFTLTLIGVSVYNSLSLYTEKEAELKELYAQLSSREIHVAIIEADGKGMSFARSGDHVELRFANPPEKGDVRLSGDTLYLKKNINTLRLPHLKKMWCGGKEQILPDLPYTTLR